MYCFTDDVLPVSATSYNRQSGFRLFHHRLLTSQRDHTALVRTPAQPSTTQQFTAAILCACLMPGRQLVTCLLLISARVDVRTALSAHIADYSPLWSLQALQCFYPTCSLGDVAVTVVGNMTVSPSGATTNLGHVLRRSTATTHAMTRKKAYT